MKNKPTLPNMRNRERGAVAVVVAFTWTALFGVAVLAIDFGYLYAKRRGLQAAADGLLKVSMPDWVSYYPTGFSQATSDAQNRASAFGYSSAEVSTTEDVPGNTFTVKVSRTYPTFIGGLFGMTGKTVSGTATGQRQAAGGGATIQALNGAVCGGFPTWGAGFFIQGGPGTQFTVNGSVESGTQAVLQTDAFTPSTITGTLKTDCPTPLVTGGGQFNAANATVTGGQITIASGGGVVSDSISLTAAALAPFCTNGSLTAAVPITWTWTPGVGGCDTPSDDIYCSMGVIAVNPISFGQALCPGSRATFISLQQVTFGANNGIALLPSTKPTLNATAARLIAVAYGNAGGVTCATQDIFFGAATTFALGSNTQDAYIYAPNGCVGAGGGASGWTSYGKIVAQNIDFQPSPGSGWIFNGAGGGASSGWKLFK